MSGVRASVTAAALLVFVGCSSAPEASAPARPTPADAPVEDSAGEPAEEPAEEPAAQAQAELPAPYRAALDVDTVVIRPERIELDVGETFALTGLQVEPRDADGGRIEGVPIRTLLQSRIATLQQDTLETGVVGQVVRAHLPGEASLIVALPQPVRADDGGYEVEARILRVPLVVRAGPVASVELDAPQRTVYAGTSVTLGARAATSSGAEREDVEISWSVDRPDVATVTEDGLLRARGAGSVTVTAAADGAEQTATLEVVENPVRSLELTPSSAEVRTGDVVRFDVAARDAQGRTVDDAPIVYSVTSRDPANRAGAAVYEDGAFVADEPGTFRVVATTGAVSTEAVVVAEPRAVELGAERLGLGGISDHPTSDLWVFEGRDGRDYAYTGTHVGGQKMFAWNVSDPSNPALTDSVVVDARVVNDVKVNDDASLAVITREGASDRRNGIVLLDLTDPAHPTVIGEYTETLTGGVHNTYIVDDLVYAIHDGTLDVHIIDISDPANPQEVGRWGIDQPGKYLHDIWVEDGLAYVSYWDDGVYILDVGDGRWGGTPTEPAVVSSYSYRTQWGDQEFGNTHVAFPYTNSDGESYLFVGDEIFGCAACTSRASPGHDGPRGHVHVIDMNDPENLEEVAFYRVPEAGAHNLWVDDDRLYVGYYEGGLRVVDVSGELRGDLYAQGREMAWFSTGTEDGYIANTPMAWGPQPYGGNVFVADYNSGLWVIRLTPEPEGSTHP